MPEWNWRGRDRITGAIKGFYTNGPQTTPAELKDHVEEHYRGLEFVDATPAEKAPTILVPVESRYFSHGILESLAAENGRPLRGKTIAEILNNPLFTDTPIAQRSVPHAHSGRSDSIQRGLRRGLISSRLQLLRT